MDEYLTRLSAASNKLSELIKSGQVIDIPVDVSASSLSEYLAKTAEIEMDSSSRLQALAYVLIEALSWKQVCTIYERMLEEDGPDEHRGTFATWTILADQMLSDPAREESERSEILAGLESVMKRVMDEDLENSGFALGMGISFYREASRRRDNGILIEKAEKWLDEAVYWSDEDNESDVQCCCVAVLYRAHCFVLRGEWKQALEVYSLVDVDQQYDPEGDAAEMAENIALCKRNLAKT